MFIVFRKIKYVARPEKMEGLIQSDFSRNLTDHPAVKAEMR